MSRLLDDDGLLRGMSPTALTVACVVIPLVAFIIKAGYFMTLDPREPPLVRSKVPFIGHILGLITEESNYFTRLACVCPPSPFPLPLN